MRSFTETVDTRSKPYPTLTQYSRALALPPGVRPFGPALDFLKPAELIADSKGHFFHAAAGSYAVVFKLKLRKQIFALRLPLRRQPVDIEYRYKCLRNHLSWTGTCSKFFPGFQYYSSALHVDGDWVPALLTEWIEGKSIGSVAHAAAAIGDQRKLRTLTLNFATMMMMLRKAGIAHGDLSDGNILVESNGQLKLVDLDTIYVAGLEKAERRSLGTPGYMHPKLGAAKEVYPKLKPQMDNFPFLVIVTSLAALTLMPRIHFAGSTEKLLFRVEDLEHHKSSELFKLLLNSEHALVRNLTRELDFACSLSREHAIDIPTICQEVFQLL